VKAGGVLRKCEGGGRRRRRHFYFRDRLIVSVCDFAACWSGDIFFSGAERLSFVGEARRSGRWQGRRL
jgi:hypothetical protein